jgi:uncharacterized protein (TIGR00743 family)
MSTIFKNLAQETAACCCVDVGSIIDNSDNQFNYQHTFTNRADAESVAKELTEKARSVESDPCIIEQNIIEQGQDVVLTMAFTFSCQAEQMIFQLQIR